MVLAVNKMDQVGMTNPDIYEFYNLGLGIPSPSPPSTATAPGTCWTPALNTSPEEEEEEDTDLIKVAVIGKPNVGKSSLINRILGEERVIVSDMAGTTRDAVDSYFENETGKFLFIDTAGMRKKAKVTDQIEKFSVLRAAMAIERSNVCLIMIDANEGVTEQDTKVAGHGPRGGEGLHPRGQQMGCDVEKDDKTMDKMRQDIRRDLAYMTYAPIVFISALTGQRVDRLFQLIKYVDDQAAMRITTGMLNNVLADATARVQPPTDKGRRLKIYYMTQAGIRPPHFVFFCNDAKLFHFSYQRYLENQVRATFGLEGTPIRLTVRQRGDKGGVSAMGLTEHTVSLLASWGASAILPAVVTAVIAYFCGCFNGAVIVSKVHSPGRCPGPRQRQRGADQLLPHLRRPPHLRGDPHRRAQSGGGGAGGGVAHRPAAAHWQRGGPNHRHRPGGVLVGAVLPAGAHVPLHVPV